MTRHPSMHATTSARCIALRTGIGVLGFLTLALVAAGLAAAAGCGARVGARSDQTVARVGSINGAPVEMTFVTPEDGTWNTRGTGPASFADVGESGIQQFSSGYPPRNIMYDRTTGRFVISSGSDVSAEGVELHPETGLIRIARFKTLTSEPIRAGNEAYDRLVQYWSFRDEASRQALADQMRMIESVAPEAAALLKSLLTAAGVPLP